MTNEPDPDDAFRRKLVMGLVAGGSALVGAATSNVAGRVIETGILHTAPFLDVTLRSKAKFRQLFDDRVPSVSRGEGNYRLSKAAGEPRVSPQIQNADEFTQQLILNVFDDRPATRIDEARLLRFGATGPGIYFGGPYANREASLFLGYEFREDHALETPQVLPGGNFRLPFNYISPDLVSAAVTPPTLIRLHEGFEISEPARTLFDRRNDRFLPYPISSDGRLEADYVQIISVRDHNGDRKLFMWGLYAQGLDAISNEASIDRLLDRLVRRGDDAMSFHTIVRVQLSEVRRFGGLGYRSEVDWTSVEKDEFYTPLGPSPLSSVRRKNRR